MIASDLRSLYLRPTATCPKLNTTDASELRRTIEEGPAPARLLALNSLIVSLVNGERDLVEGLLMSLIRFVLPLKDKTVKRVLLLLFENMNKTDSEGNLKQEFILVCNSWRNDLQHPNEFVRGATLRFLCHLREPELLEPLMPSVRSCLDHEHSYVRKNAINAISTIYKHLDYLIPDAPELIESLLSQESDVSCQKFAFIFLSQTEPLRAVNYFNLITERVAEMDGSLQLAVIEFIQQAFQSTTIINDQNSEMSSKFFKVLLGLLKKSSSSGAKFESACTLISYSESTEIIKIAVDALITLAAREADNSIKLIILTKLQTEILPIHPEIIQSTVLDLLRVLSSPDSSVRRVCLQLLVSVTTSRVALEIVQFLKKEVSKASKLASSSSNNDPSAQEYRQNVLDALYKCSMKFSEVGTEVMNAYLELLKTGFINENLVSYMKEALFKYPKLRKTYLSSVISTLPSVSDSKSLRSLLWLIGEFSVDTTSILSAIQAINSGLGELPMLAVEEKYEADMVAAANNNNSKEFDDLKEKGKGTEINKKVGAFTKILADGTYASEVSDGVVDDMNENDSRQLPNIKKLFLDGKFECSGVLADTLCKLMIRLKNQKQFNTTTTTNTNTNTTTNTTISQYSALRTRVLLILTSILRLGGSKYPLQPIDGDSAERVALCIQIIINESEESCEESVLERALTVDSEEAFNLIQQGGGVVNTMTEKACVSAIDDVIDFKLISAFNEKPRAKKPLSSEEALNLVLDDSFNNNYNENLNNLNNLNSLNRVVQLTGFSDVIYAETYVKMSGKEVLLDLLLVNQTEEILQNVSIDLVCAGDLKLIEKPPQLTLPPYSFSAGKAIFKVTATNHGQIFGCISFNQSSSSQDTESVILSEIKIDVLEYIKPGFILEPIFRETWVLLEWENKISIKVQRAGELKDFLSYLIKQGHLTCITPNVFIETGAVDTAVPAFLACNLYAKSIFDEEILANLSLEINSSSKLITGHLRLRSKTQGLAVAFGDKLNALIQKLK